MDVSRQLHSLTALIHSCYCDIGCHGVSLMLVKEIASSVFLCDGGMLIQRGFGEKNDFRTDFGL